MTYSEIYRKSCKLLNEYGSVSYRNYGDFIIDQVFGALIVKDFLENKKGEYLSLHKALQQSDFIMKLKVKEDMEIALQCADDSLKENIMEKALC